MKERVHEAKGKLDQTGVCCVGCCSCCCCCCCCCCVAAVAAILAYVRVLDLERLCSLISLLLALIMSLLTVQAAARVLCLPLQLIHFGLFGLTLVYIMISYAICA